MKSSGVPVFILLIFLIQLSSCVEPFEADFKEYENLLVVQGLITDKEGQYEVRLSRTLSLGLEISILPENNAFVIIRDDQGNEEILTEEKKGIYKTQADGIKGVVGRTYTLWIKTKDDEEYESSPVQLCEVTEVDTLYYEKNDYLVYSEFGKKQEKGIQIFLDTRNGNNTTIYYRWEFEEAWEYNLPYQDSIDIPDIKKYCWQTEFSREILIKSTENFSNNKVEKFPVNFLPSWKQKLYGKYGIHVKQYSTNKELFLFWEKLKKVNEINGGLYDVIPASIYGNIYPCEPNQKKALGYFDASEVKEKTLYIRAHEHQIKTSSDLTPCLADTTLEVVELSYSPDLTEMNTVIIQKIVLDEIIEETYYIIGQIRDSFNSYLATSFRYCSDCRINASSRKPDFWELN